MTGDLGKAFKTFKKEFLIPYKGCTIIREWGGYKVGKCLFATEDLAKKEIDRQFEVWGNKLKK